MLFETDVVLLLGAGEVLADDPEKLGLEVLHLAGREFRPVIGEHELEAFLDVILAAAPTEETEHQRPPNRRVMPAMKPPCGSVGRKATASPRTRRAMLREAGPACERLPAARWSSH